eukprot:6219348-Amphidinium_carterae.1
MVKAGSPSEDNSTMALHASLCLVRLQCRVWYEHVRTEANPADPLSRAAEKDPWVAAKLETH